MFNPGTGVVNPRLDQGAVPLRFSTDPATLFLSAVQNQPKGFCEVRPDKQMNGLCIPCQIGHGSLRFRGQAGASRCCAWQD